MKVCAVIRVCRTLVVLAVWLAVSAHHGAMAAEEEPLYPHAERQTGPWGYIDKTGKVVIPLQFEAAEPFSEGLAAVKRHRKFGFIDRTGRLAIEHQFDGVQPFGSGRAAVRVGEAWGLINETGTVLVAPTYSGIKPFSDDRAVVSVRGLGNHLKFGAIDRAGKVVIAPEYDHMLPFSEGLAAAKLGHLWGYVAPDGSIAIPMQFAWKAGSFSEGLAKVARFARTTSVSGFIDREGKVVVPFDFAEANEFADGVATVRDKDRGWGVIDPTGKVVIAPQFAHVGWSKFGGLTRGLLSEGLLAVSDGKAFGYVDREGRFVVPPRFLHAYAFQDGLAVVSVGSEEVFGAPSPFSRPMGVIDRSGRFVVKPVFETTKLHPGGLIQVWFGGRVGYFDATGRALTVSDKDIEEYVAHKREQVLDADKRWREHLAKHLGPPPQPGRAVIGKAGDAEYYLRLPDGVCALSPHSIEDRKHLEAFWAKEAAAAQEAARKLPQASESQPQVSEELRKSTEELKRNSGLVANCGQLNTFRVSGDRKALKTYAVAAGLQKDRYDFSANAGIVYMAGFLCTVAEKGRLGMPPAKPEQEDKSVRVWSAFKRLEAGESTSLGALAREPLACYSATLAPWEAHAGAPPAAAPAKGRVAFHTMVFLPDWLVQVFTRDVPAESPEALFGELAREKAFAGALQKANLKAGPTKF